jgi:hypothetical protein
MYARTDRRSPRRDLHCAACGYGIVRAAPPERCPMCQGEQTWVHAPWRPFSSTGQSASRSDRGPGAGGTIFARPP